MMVAPLFVWLGRSVAPALQRIAEAAEPGADPLDRVAALAEQAAQFLLCPVKRRAVGGGRQDMGEIGAVEQATQQPLADERARHC